MQLPDAKTLTAGANELGVSLSAEHAESLLAYLALLAKWNRVYNLTAVRNPSAMLVQHLLDSIAIVAPLRRWTGGKPARVLDVGSGAGLPGVVIAELLPELDVTCVDAVGKKAAFIRQVAGELTLKNLHSAHSRVETLAGEPFDVIVSRAFASLADFVKLTWRHRGPGSVWIAMKASPPPEELVALPKTIDVFHVEQRLVPGLDAARCLIWMREQT
jgi:16S rRNA (guanine527-N7)-methyltransferase